MSKDLRKIETFSDFVRKGEVVERYDKGGNIDV